MLPRMSRWPLRATPTWLARSYRDAGLWTDQTLGQLLGESLSTNARQEFRVWSTTRPYRGTVADVHDLARRLAGGLARLGIGPDDVVAFQLPNWEEAAATFYGVCLLGAALVPVVHFYGPKELGFILRQSGARALVTADTFGHLDYLQGLEQLLPAVDTLEHVVVVGSDRASRPQGPPGAIPLVDLLEAVPVREGPMLDPSGPAVIAYTSGTTSDPKGVIHSHQSLSAELHQAVMTWSPDARPSLMGAPVGHAIGMLGGLLGPLYRGRAIHLTDVWNPEAVLASLVEGDLVFGGGATYFLTSLLDCPSFAPSHLEHIRSAGLGGSPVPSSVGERASALGISLIRSYGSTEHPSITGAAHDEPLEKRLYTDGHPLAGVEIRLRDEDGEGVEPGRAGHIESRGPELFAGYTDPGLTAAAVDSEGWYSTGDIGMLDGDGYLTITDRSQDIIIRGGENISAAEVEEQLLMLEGIAEVAVVAAPDERLGEHACAFLRPRPGSRVPGMEAVRRHLEETGLARQKWPEELRVVADLPRTPSSKVKKYVLRQQLRSGQLAAGQP